MLSEKRAKVPTKNPKCGEECFRVQSYLAPAWAPPLQHQAARLVVLWVMWCYISTCEPHAAVTTHTLHLSIGAVYALKRSTLSLQHFNFTHQIIFKIILDILPFVSKCIMKKHALTVLFFLMFGPNSPHADAVSDFQTGREIGHWAVCRVLCSL